MNILASQQLIHGYRVCKLVLYKGKYIWKFYDYCDDPLLITIPSNRPDKLMMVNVDSRNNFYYLDFCESDLNAD